MNIRSILYLALLAAALVDANPAITSVLPTTGQIFGTTITITGTGFNSQTITYVQIGSLPVATSFVKNSDTQIVATFAGVGSAYSSLSLFVGWGTTSYAQLSNSFAYIFPSISSAHNSGGTNYLPSYGSSTLTIVGDNFGHSSGAYSYVQLGAYPVATSFAVVDNQHMTATFTAPGETSKQTIFVAWPGGNYVQLNNDMCWCYDGGLGGSSNCAGSPCFL
jgi:hypothetical protein